jgi:pyrroloquinoline quinone biosynthesis protein B
MQIEAFAPLHPRSLRGTPIDGAALTDANVDHLGGLTALRQSGNHRFVMLSSRIVRDIATAQIAFAPFAREPHRWDAVSNDGQLELSGLRLRALALPGTTPGYAGRREEPGAVFAYEIRGADSGASILFAPVFSAIDDPLFEAIGRATVAFLDGTFFSDDELMAGGLMEKTARQLGHQPVGGRGGTLERLRGVRTRIVFTHVNNSNPMLDPASAAALEVRNAGSEIAYDGMML